MTKAVAIAPMKVMHIITNLEDGGAEGALYRLCTHSHLQAHFVISLMNGGKYGPMLVAAGVNLHCLGMPRGRLTWSGIIQLWKLIQIIQPDVVQAWMYHANLVGGLVAWICGVKKIYWGIRHGNLIPNANKYTTIIVAKLCAHMSYFIPRRVVSCSHQALEMHVGIGYKRSRMIVIPNGYDLSLYTPDFSSRLNLRHALSISENTFLIGMVARYDAQKDHANLLTALHILKLQGASFQCMLVGAGMDINNKQLQKIIFEYGLENNVTLLGPRNDIPVIMNALDLHVLSSLGEAFPNVIAEAMACGTLCISTDVGDAALIVGDTGWITPPQDSAAIANGVNNAMLLHKNKPDLWESRKQAARKRILNNFSIEKIVDAYSSVWES